jgi:CRISPR/Cas system-associated protein Csm6
MDIRKLDKMVDMYVKVDWRNYFDEAASPAVHNYINNNADTIYPWLFDVIKHAIDKKLEEVAIVKFIDSKMYATIKKEDYKELLQKILEHFISKEEYEICAEIRDLINKKERKSRKKEKKVLSL